jgi:hypothetical protein
MVKIYPKGFWPEVEFCKIGPWGTSESARLVHVVGSSSKRDAKSFECGTETRWYTGPLLESGGQWYDFFYSEVKKNIGVYVQYKKLLMPKNNRNSVVFSKMSHFRR